jgi:pimeloyl-ACP methyl ester carboxylesterase
MLPGLAVLGEWTRAHLIDLPGMSGGGEPPHELSVAEYADAVAGLLDAQNFGPVLLAGQSSGTQVAAQAGCRAPHAVAAVVLVCPTIDPAARHVVPVLWRRCPVRTPSAGATPAPGQRRSGNSPTGSPRPTTAGGRWERRVHETAVAIGSSGGALTHLYAALGIPWLPQTLLLPVRQRGLPPDLPRRAAHADRRPLERPARPERLVRGRLTAALPERPANLLRIRAQPARPARPSSDAATPRARRGDRIPHPTVKPASRNPCRDHADALGTPVSRRRPHGHRRTTVGKP